MHLRNKIIRKEDISCITPENIFIKDGLEREILAIYCRENYLYSVLRIRPLNSEGVIVGLKI